MCLRFVFLPITRTASWLRLSRREEAWQTAEILLLRHQLTVLQRQQPRRPNLNWADRVLIALLFAVIPKARRHGLQLLVTPDTIVRWHRDIVRRRWAARSVRGNGAAPALAGVHDMQRLITKSSRVVPVTAPRRGTAIMSAMAAWAGRIVLRLRVVPVALILLTAGLGALAAAQGAASIAAGGYKSCAIESGKAYCWGDNGLGELGDGGTTYSLIPVAVDTGGVLAGKTLTQITAGGGFTCALDSIGAAYCWGLNNWGNLGDGSTTSSNTPAAVDAGGVLAGKTLTQISVGGEHACALDSSGAAYCWGINGSGELGDGNTRDSSIPVAVNTSGVLAGKTLTQISAGDDATCALDSSGAAYCWGLNNYGQLGDARGGGSSIVPVTVDAG